jgi:hypothetical protein
VVGVGRVKHVEAFYSWTLNMLDLSSTSLFLNL